MTGMLSTGSSALLAFQRALNTVSHNVANSATAGYSRQRVELASRPGLAGAVSIGQGVDIAKLQRLADGLVFSRQVDSSGEMGRLQQLSTFNARLDTLVSDSATGLAQPFAAFFAAAESVSAEPTSTIARNSLLQAGDQLASRWRALDGQMAAIDSELDVRMQSQITEVNRLTGEIAKLNRDVIASGANASADLLDARDLRIQQLAGLVGAHTVAQDDGALNVFTAGGQPLVLGTQTSALTTSPDPFRPDRLQLSLSTPTGAVRLPADSVSGEIGGLLEYRGRVLDPARAELGRLATVFATEFNAQQAAGVDYNGAVGGNFFAIPAPHVGAHAANTGAATITAAVADTSTLQGADFVMRFDGTAWSATRADTGAPVAMSGAGTAASPFLIAGLSLTVAGAAAAGDRYTVSPTIGVASGITRTLTDPSAIAAATPLQAAAATTNLGAARVNTTSVTNAGAFAGFGGAVVDFIDANNYTVNGAGPFAYTAGSAITGSGWSMNLQGAPAAGDRFTLSRTPARSADNGNARALAALDDRRILDGGTVSIGTGLGQLTAKVGGEARHADLTLEAQSAINEQVNAERESTSGVNLDEEAADLMRFQQAYQAAAQVIATADTLFQSLLGAVRR